MAYELHDGLLLTPKEAARFKRRTELLHEAIALRERGATFAEIGSLSGVTRQAAQHFVSSAFTPVERKSA